MLLEKQADRSFSNLGHLGPPFAIFWLREARKRRASARPFMLITIITLLFCVAQDLLPEASALFAGMETNTAILALSVFVFIVFRIWYVMRVESLRAGSQ